MTWHSYMSPNVECAECGHKYCDLAPTPPAWELAPFLLSLSCHHGSCSCEMARALSFSLWRQESIAAHLAHLAVECFGVLLGRDDISFPHELSQRVREDSCVAVSCLKPSKLLTLSFCLLQCSVSDRGVVMLLARS